MLNLSLPGRRPSGSLALATTCFILFFSIFLCAQSTTGTGGIRGIVIAPTGAGVADAAVTITNKVRASVIHVTTSDEGVYSSGPLEPGNYTVRIAAKGFKTVELALASRVGVATGGNVKLEAGAETEIQKLAAEDVVVNAEQPTVQSLVTADQIHNFPSSSTNYLDLAQIAPGVQLQDAGVLNASKTGLSSISFASQYGRDARVEVDGVSVSDDTIGGVAQNLPTSAILEADLAQSSLDLPVQTTANGTVNIATRSGGDALHAEIFGTYRGHQGSAALPGSGNLPFSREWFGARAGGPVTNSKLFWFVDIERLQQSVTSAQPFDAPFNNLATALSQPLREWMGDARLDWQRRENAHGFYRFGYDDLSQVRPFGASSSLQEFRNSLHAPSHTFGYDFSHGPLTHSFRLEYMRYGGGVSDYTGTIPAGVDNPIPGLGINIGAPVLGLCASGGGSYCSGPSPYAPQTNFQSLIEFKYDGTRVVGRHIFRYGAVFNHIHAGGSSAAYTNSQVGTTNLCLPNVTLPVCVTSADPTAYPADSVFLGNGIGFSTTQSAFGLSGGGLGPDNQIEAYGGDSWKLGRNLVVTYGVRYVHDSASIVDRNGSLSILNQWQPGLSNAPRNPRVNFAPQFGFAWDAGGTGKTIIRGGAGLYYASSLWNDALLDSRARSAKGNLAQTAQVCNAGNPVPFLWPTSLAGASVGSGVAGGAGIVTNPNSNLVEPTFCGTTIGSAASSIFALSNAFQSAAASGSASGANINFVANTLTAANINGTDVFNPDYRAPRSWQMNLGFQQELRPGTILSVDYVRQIGLHNVMVLDGNHSGASYSYNFVNAQVARDNAQTAAGCATGWGQAQCMVTALGSVAAAQSAYSRAGLDSNSAVTGGAPCSYCAFPGYTLEGINNNGAGAGTGSLGTLDMLNTVGRSVYAGYQARLVQRVLHPLQGVKEANFQLSYAYSKYVSQSNDSSFPSVATDNDRPLLFTGSNAMDRKHQFSLSGTFDLPHSAKLSLIGHFYSPLAQNLLLPELTNGGEIYATDWLGSGLGSGGLPEPVRGTQLGQYNRGTNINTLPRVISTYNTNFAGTLTHAGGCLTGNQQICPGNAPVQVLTQFDMQTLGWVMPTLPASPFDAWSSPWLKTLDLKASWPIKIGERFTLEPSASVFNVLNFTNAFQAGNSALSSLMPGPNPTAVTNGVLAPSAVGGVVGGAITPFRAGFQSGTFALGAPRQLEFGLRISF